MGAAMIADGRLRSLIKTALSRTAADFGEEPPAVFDVFAGSAPGRRKSWIRRPKSPEYGIRIYAVVVE
jgi:hypothetical protein